MSDTKPLQAQDVGTGALFGGWLRCGSQRVRLAAVESYENQGQTLRFCMQGGGSVYWHGDGMSDIPLEEQVRQMAAKLDEYFSSPNDRDVPRAQNL